MSMKTTLQTEREIEEFNIFADELEHEWKTSRQRLTEKQLVEIFSPPREMIQQKLDEWEARRLKVVEQMKQSLKNIYRVEINAFSHWFGAFMVRLYLQPELDECNQQIRRLKRILHILTPEVAMGFRDQAVERARNHSIYELAQGAIHLKKSGNKYSALCPFHEEKHASFYIYPETNTYHCFGCQTNGDIIKLTMHLYGASFREAVKMLQ